MAVQFQALWLMPFSARIPVTSAMKITIATSSANMCPSNVCVCHNKKNICGPEIMLPVDFKNAARPKPLLCRYLITSNVIHKQEKGQIMLLRKIP